jgi:hypothetical protein
MAHELRADPALALVDVVYHGEVAAPEREQAIREAARLLSETDFRRVLVDLRKATIVSEPTHVMVALAHEIAHAPALYSSRLAYLVTPEQEANRIIENMAVARDMQVGRFHERETAIAWLLDDAPEPASDRDR